MGVKKKTKQTPKGHNLRAAIVANVEELLTQHMAGILTFIDEAEDKKEKVSFGVEINCAESEPQVKVGIRYSQSVTDTRSVILDDPDQGTFEPVVKDAEKETDKRRKKNVAKLKEGEQAPVEDPAAN